MCRLERKKWNSLFIVYLEISKYAPKTPGTNKYNKPEGYKDNI